MTFIRLFTASAGCPNAEACKTCGCTLRERIQASGFVPMTTDIEFLHRVFTPNRIVISKETPKKI